MASRHGVLYEQSKETPSRRHAGQAAPLSMQALSISPIPVAFMEADASAIPTPLDIGAASSFEVRASSSMIINGPAPISHLRIQGVVNENDKARVEQILISTAEQFAMLETTFTSGVRGTIRCYSESPKGGFAAGARIFAEDIFVDFFAGRELSLRFPGFVEHICAELRRVFVERITVVKR
jgi:hypothetical protein